MRVKETHWIIAESRSSSKIRFGATAVLPPLAVAALASHVHFLRTGETQALSSDTRVAIHNLSIYWRFKPTLSGKTHNKAMLIGNPFLHDTYLTKDNRRIMLCAVYPELRLKWYSFLKVRWHVRHRPNVRAR